VEAILPARRTGIFPLCSSPSFYWLANCRTAFSRSYTRTLWHWRKPCRRTEFLARILHWQWPNLASAYITGISVGILVRSPAFWPYALCALDFDTSKYVLRVHGRHIWNPRNFGTQSVLSGLRHSPGLSIQWGNFVWPMIVIWVLGSAIIWRLRRSISARPMWSRSWRSPSFAAGSTGDPWQSRKSSPITGPMYQLFLSFFLHD